MAKKVQAMADEAEDAPQKPVEPKAKDDDDIIAEAKKFFDDCLEAESDQRAEEIDDIRFVGLLEQWPEDLKAIREASPSGARPCLVTDKVNQYKNQIVNDIRKNRAGIKARPVDDTGDEEVADVIQGIIRHIEDISRADIAYDWAIDGSVTSGIGYFRVLTEYVGDSFQQEIFIKRIPNRFSVYTKFKEPDGSDQTKCLITELVNRDEFKQQYPDADPQDWASSSGDGKWATLDDVRVAEYMYLEKTPMDLYLLADGNSAFADDYDNLDIKPPVLKTRKGEKTKVCWVKMTGAEVLERTTIPGKYIPVIPSIGVETWMDGKKYLRGIVRGAKDAARLYNYQRSTVAELLNLSVKAPYIGAVGQFKSRGQDWEAANIVPFAYLEYDPVDNNGRPEPPPQRQSFAGVPTGLIQDMQTSEHDIQSGLGMYQASIGQDSNAKSGVALNTQQKQGDTATFHFADNHNKSIRWCGNIILNMIPEVYDTARVVRIIGEDGSIDYAHINPDQQMPVNKIQDQNGAIHKIYNLGMGQYDITITSGQSYATKRMEGADFLTQLVQSSPESMQIVGDLLMKSMDVPYAEIAAERYKKMLPPQLQDTPDDSTPEVQQIKQQATQQIQMLTQQLDAAHQAMQEAEQEAKQLEQKANDSQAKNTIEAASLKIDWYKAETDRLKVELDAKQQQQVIDERLRVIEDGLSNVINIVSPSPQAQPEEQTQPAMQQ